jgi:hypothetical protein
MQITFKNILIFVFKDMEQLEGDGETAVLYKRAPPGASVTIL